MKKSAYIQRMRTGSEKQDLASGGGATDYGIGYRVHPPVEQKRRSFHLCNLPYHFRRKGMPFNISKLIKYKFKLFWWARVLMP